MAAPVVLLAPGVYRIPTMGDFINSFAFVDPDGQVTLVDCGITRAPRRIVEALAGMGRHPSDVTRILLQLESGDPSADAVGHRSSRFRSEGFLKKFRWADQGADGQAPSGFARNRLAELGLRESLVLGGGGRRGMNLRRPKEFLDPIAGNGAC